MAEPKTNTTRKEAAGLRIEHTETLCHPLRVDYMILHGTRNGWLCRSILRVDKNRKIHSMGTREYDSQPERDQSLDRLNWYKIRSSFLERGLPAWCELSAIGCRVEL